MTLSDYDPHESPRTHTVYLSGESDDEGPKTQLVGLSGGDNSDVAPVRRGRRPSLGGRQSSLQRLRARSRTLSRDSSMSRSRSPSARRPAAPNRSTVWSSDSMTSFRVSRRSLAVTHLDTGCDPMDTKSRHSRSDRDTDSDFHESANTLIIDEAGVLKSDPLEGASSSSGSDNTQHQVPERSLNNSYRTQHEDEVVQHAKPKLWNVRLVRFRVACGNLVNSIPVQVAMSCLILTNAIILGAMTYDSVRVDDEAMKFLEGLDLAILVAFTLEVVLHLIYLGLRLFSDSWLTFDFLVIVVSWCFLDSPVAVMRSLRIFRVFSIVSRWESLRTLFEAIGGTIPKMASIWASLLIFFYVFCVLFTNLYHSLYDDGFYDEDYFGRLDKTFVTLFQTMTLDNWSVVARSTMEYSPWSFLGFFFFIIFTSFFVINLVVAVICESLIQISRGPTQQPSVSNIEMDDDGSIEDDQTSERLEELMRQLLKNQMAMAASIIEIQRELNELKGKGVDSEEKKASLAK